jgi:peptidoglycan hydrolase CwlO-like protein
MRGAMKRVISLAIAIFFVFSLLMVKGQEGEVGEFYQLKQKEQEVILEILKLDVEKLKSEKALEEISAEIEELNESIKEKTEEINRTSEEIDKEKDTIKTWFRFLYMSGTNAILSLLLMADNASELLHRLIYVDIITNYYYDKLENLYNLVKYKKEEEKQLTLKKEELLKKQEEEKKVIKKIEDLRANKDKILEEIRKKLSNYQKILEIVENTSSSLSSLDFLLSSISKLPWGNLQPKDLKFSFFSAEASFYDKDVTELVQSFDERLKNVEVVFKKEGFEVKEEGKYLAKGNFEIEDDKIKLKFMSINVQGILIEGSFLEKLIEGYDTRLNFNIPLEGWKLKQVSTEDGYVKILLKK